MIKTCKGCGGEFETNRSNRDYCGRSCSNSAIARDRESKKLDVSAKIVWSCGGGVQSSGIAALIVKGELPKPDYAVMVDVGREKQSTWEHVNKVLMPQLASVGVTLNIIKTTDYRDIDLHNNGCLLIPAYEKADKGRKRFKTLCSNTWKAAVIRKWLRGQGMQKCVVWLGISLNETRRMRPSAYRWCENHYPLIEKQMYKEDCLYLTAQMGWPMAPRTSCWMCPGQTNQEWYVMKKFWPCDWRRAVELEKEIQKVDPDVYLHAQLVPLDEVDLKQRNPYEPCVRNVNDCVCL